MPKILTEQEVAAIGGGVTSSPNKGCTNVQAIALGCKSNASYAPNQLISHAEKAVTLTTYNFVLNYNVMTTFADLEVGQVGESILKLQTFSLRLRSQTDNSVVMISDIPSNAATVQVSAGMSRSNYGSWNISFSAPIGQIYRLESCNTTWGYVSGVQGYFEVMGGWEEGTTQEELTSQAMSQDITEGSNPTLDYYSIYFMWHATSGFLNNYENDVTFIALGGKWDLASPYVPQVSNKGNTAIFTLTYPYMVNDGTIKQASQRITSLGNGEEKVLSLNFLATNASNSCIWTIEMPSMKSSSSTQFFYLRFPSWVDVKNMSYNNLIWGNDKVDGLAHVPMADENTNTLRLGFLDHVTQDTSEYVVTIPFLSSKDSNANALVIQLVSKEDSWTW